MQLLSFLYTKVSDKKLCKFLSFPILKLFYGTYCTVDCQRIRTVPYSAEGQRMRDTLVT
jgi:hypothetical protein